MLLDGQQIFKATPTLASQFIFSDLWAIVQGTSTASILGTVTNEQTGLPINAAIVRKTNTDTIAVTNPEGHYELALGSQGNT